MKFVIFKFLQISCFFVLFFPRPSFAMMEDYPSVKLQGLDKSVGRTVTFEAKVGDTIQYGTLFVKIHACRKAPPIEKPESAAFLQIWEVPIGQKESEWVFSGWMFASSPALSAMDHPVYDVWILDCMGKEEPAIPQETSTTQDDVAVEPSKKQSLFDQVDVVDSEAEDQTSPSAQDGTTQETPQEQTDQPTAQDSEGFTAYDLMKQSIPENNEAITKP